MPKKTIAIADSSTIGRLGLRSIIKQMDGFDVIGEAENTQGIIDLIASFAPEIVIIDFLSEGFDIDTIVSIRQRFPKTLLLAITPSQSGLTLVNAMRAGVDSYIKKTCDLAEVMDAITSTAEGTSFFCGKILDKIRKESINVNDLDSVNLTCDAVELSRREKEVLCLIAEGYTNSKIAKILFLSAHTITSHRKNIMSKLGVKNTAGIVMYAVKSGIVSPNKFLFHS